MDFRARPAMKDVVARLEEASTLALPLVDVAGVVDSPAVVVDFDGKSSDLSSGDQTGMTDVTTGTYEESNSKLSGSEKDAFLALLVEKDALLAEKDALLAKQDAILAAENDARHAEKDARLLEMQSRIQELEATRLA